MSHLMIPCYAQGFQLDWTRVVPINYDDVGMYVSPRIAITFEKIWSEQKQEHFSIGHVFETCEDFDCKDFKERILAFKPFREARVNRTFEGHRNSIFFDAEEVEILAGIFKNVQFTALVNIYVDGKKVDIENMPENLFKIVKPLLEYYKVVFPLDVSNYRRYKSIRKIRIIKEIKIGGSNNMNKKMSLLKIAGGILLEGVSIAGSLVGMKLINDGYEETIGKVQEVAVVEHVDETKEQNK